MTKAKKYSVETRERAVRLVFDGVPLTVEGGGSGESPC